ncbi:hypothetical protein B6U74_06165 [Candidatus Bathyarchaeota archaeon ex4484_205]|nr:MAG: hypothetical protein B6U74_06165 [Candidatus Bathyarchaeota archaeon ex4484_205]RLG67998.1 MAG: hypothetical protein DRN93_03490 [archaeon]HDN18220.1 carboxypeptidase M32 [Candidatus Bathyarchaeota archaeon]
MPIENLRQLYQKIIERYRDFSLLTSIESLLFWDQQTMMPPAGVEIRGLQRSLTERFKHRIIRSRELGNLLKEILAHPDFSSLTQVEQRNIELIQRMHREAVAVPEKLISEIKRQETTTVSKWLIAKKRGDFKVVEKELGRLIELNRELSRLLMDEKEVSTLYDALIDIYEPKVSTEVIDPLFSQVGGRLRMLIDRYESEENFFTSKEMDVERQRELVLKVASFLGYRFDGESAWGRIDISEHPFTSGKYNDVRVTVHYRPGDFTYALFSALHECGHALYDHNLPEEWFFTPVGEPCSYGIHESQSRFVENIVGRSPEFWRYLISILDKLTNGKVNSDVLPEILREVNRVRRGKIRLEADEATYGLHIIIRYNVEKELFNGDLKVSELPSVWEEQYSEYLDVEVSDDREGVLQDIHWYIGAFGYFPTYLLGNLYSTIMLQVINRECKGWRNELEEGSLIRVLNWLKNNIHQMGKLYDPLVLIQRIGGKVSHQPYIQYLEDKYKGLF